MQTRHRIPDRARRHEVADRLTLALSSAAFLAALVLVETVFKSAGAA